MKRTHVRHMLPLAALLWACVPMLGACGGQQKKAPQSGGLGAQGQAAAAGDPAAAAGDPAAAASDPSAAAPVAAPAGGGGNTGPAPESEVRAARASVRGGQYERAIRQAKQALRKSEKYTPAMVVMARAYYHLGKHEFTESICEMALKLKSSIGECYALLGHISLKQDNRDLALKNFEKATQVEPGYAPGWLNYGALLLGVKNYGAAVNALSRAVEMLESRPEAHLNLGSAYRGNGQLVEARRELLTALKLRPGYPAAYFNLGILYLDATKVFDGKQRLQQLEEAMSYFNRYKATGRSSKDDPINEYVEQAQKLHKKEKRRIEREARKKAKK